MNQLLPLLVLAILTPGLVCYQDNSLKSEDKAKANLKVTASIIEQTECLDFSRFDANRKPIASIRISLKLRVEYVNTGTYPVILHKSKGLIGSVYISHTEEKARSHFYEIMEHWQFTPTTLRVGKTERFPSDSFIIIQPGERHEGESTTSFLVDYSGTLAEPSYEHLITQDHYIRFAVCMDDGRLYLSEDLEYLRASWLKYGHLWAGSVFSEPITIRFANSQYFGQCE